MLFTLAVTMLLQGVLQSSPLPGLLIERRVARDAGLSVGDSLRVRAIGSEPTPRWFRVEGVFERAADPNRISRNEYEVRLHLPDLESLLPSHDRVDRFAVELAPGSDPDSAARWMEGLAFGTRAIETAALADQTSATFLVISRFHRAIGIVTVLASGIFLLCVMLIRVDERRRDAGVLRLVGISARTIFRTVVLEALAIAVIGSLLGALLGAVMTVLVNRHYGSVYDTTLSFALLTPRIIGLAVALGLLLGGTAGVIAAARLARAPIERLGER